MGSTLSCNEFCSSGGKDNYAFVFIKPHAQLSSVRALVEQKLKERSIAIRAQGEIVGGVIDQKQLIDQHYYAIASKATLLTPDKLPVPADKFKEKFGEDWLSVVASGKAVNATQACKEFGLDADGLNTEWRKCEPAGMTVKFGGGFYCGKMTYAGKSLYVFNAFFMTLRSKFTAPGSSIYYYSVRWAPASLSWADFRGSVLGPTDPGKAPAGAIRRMVLDQWKELGLQDPPNNSDNGVHASASPLEGLAERMNWLETPVASDPFGAALLATGMSEERIKAWSKDPQVSMPDGTKGSIFDALDDMDAKQCLDKLTALDLANP